LIEACIFDLDGVVTDTAEYHYLGWKKMADEANLHFDRLINEHLRGVSRKQSLQIILRHNNKKLSEQKMKEMMEKKNEYYQRLLQEISEQDYLPGIKALIISLRKIGIKTAIDYQRLLQEISEEDYLPGIKALIISLRKIGIKTAIASASKNAHVVIHNLKGERLFDFIADGYSVDKTKPAPDLFLYAAKKMEVSPSKSVVFEDAEAGIQAALSGGFLCVGIGPEERVGKATLRYSNTTEIQLEQILNLKR